MHLLDEYGLHDIAPLHMTGGVPLLLGPRLFVKICTTDSFHAFQYNHSTIYGWNPVRHITFKAPYWNGRNSRPSDRMSHCGVMFATSSSTIHIVNVLTVAISVPISWERILPYPCMLIAKA